MVQKKVYFLQKKLEEMHWFMGDRICIYILYIYIYIYIIFFKTCMCYIYIYIYIYMSFKSASFHFNLTSKHSTLLPNLHQMTLNHQRASKDFHSKRLEWRTLNLGFKSKNLFPFFFFFPFFSSCLLFISPPNPHPQKQNWTHFSDTSCHLTHSFNFCFVFQRFFLSFFLSFFCMFLHVFKKIFFSSFSRQSSYKHRQALKNTFWDFCWQMKCYF